MGMIKGLRGWGLMLVDVEKWGDQLLTINCIFLLVLLITVR